MENNILNTILKEILNTRKDLQRLDSIEEEIDSIKQRLDSIEEEIDSIKQRLDSIEEELNSVKQELNSVSNHVAIMENDFSLQIKALFSDVWVMNNDDHKLFKSNFKRLEKVTDKHSFEISTLKSSK